MAGPKADPESKRNAFFLRDGAPLPAPRGSSAAEHVFAYTLPSMALEDLVRYFARRRAQRSDYASLSQLAERNGWKQDEVLAFVRCQKHPSVKMLRDLAGELGVTMEELQRILDR